MNIFDFQCKCGKCATARPDMMLTSIANEIEIHFNKELVVTSGYRCPSHSIAVGSTSTSQHCRAMAIDFYIDGVDFAEIQEWLQETYPDRLGIGIYNSHIHVDSRAKPYRWDSRT
jgi:uncharacterized protein YcbK (DUF882 family)